MTIEATLERIADALEILAGSRAPANAKAETPAAETPAAETPAAEKPPKASKPKASAKASADATAPTKDDVRDALKEYQKRTNAAAARQILTDHGAKTLTDLPVEMYQAVINAASAEE